MKVKCDIERIHFCIAILGNGMDVFASPRFIYSHFPGSIVSRLLYRCNHLQRALRDRMNDFKAFPCHHKMHRCGKHAALLIFLEDRKNYDSFESAFGSLSSFRVGASSGQLENK